MTPIAVEPSGPLPRLWLNTCGSVVLLLAGIVLVGRFAGLPALVTLVPGGVPMAFPTAVGLLLGGGALVAHAAGRKRIGTAAASLLLALGVGALLLYGLAEPLGITRFIYDPARPVISRGEGFDGRLSPNAALAFASWGGAQLLLGARRLRPAWIGAALVLLLAIAATATVGYATGLRFAVTWWRYTSLSVLTVAALLLAGAALMAWFRRRLAAAAVARTLPFFTLAAAAVVVLVAVVVVSNDERREAAKLENQAFHVQAGIDRFIASMARLEAATRAFGLTGQEHYLERIAVHRASVAGAAEALQDLTRDNPVQRARAQALLPLIAEKFAVNDAQVAARRERGAAGAAETLRAEPPELMAGLRTATEGLEREERAVLERRRVETSLHERRLRWVLLCGGALAAGLLLTAFFLALRAQRELERANDQLEGRVRARTAELTASAARLRASEQRLRFLADTMPQLVWTVGPDGRIESLNRGYIEYVGARNELDAIEAIYGIVHPDDAAASRQEWEGMVREQRDAGGEQRLRRADGGYRWFLWRALAQRDESGRILRWIGTSTDIHDQKLAEERLEERVAARTAELGTSEERFRQAFYFAGIGMAMVGLDGRWVRVNRSLCDIVGYTEEELLRRSYQEITHPDDWDADQAQVRQLLAGEIRFYQMEKRYLHRAGQVVWIRLTASLVREATGAPAHFVSQIEDITERKNLEVRLAAARDQALEASRLKSEFLAMMSHEIRTPMNGVIGMAALLRDTPLNETQIEYVHTIESSGESLLTIINGILDYSKIEAGRVELETTVFNLRQCVQDALDLFSRRAREKQLALSAVVDPTAPQKVIGDATRLRQVLINLLGNAVKFTDRGAVILHLASQPADVNSRRERLHFSIRDTGIGIAPEGMAKLFQSFSQVDASTTRRFGGTGLGLAISKRLAELMGGSIWAESELGVGSTFHFTAVVEHERTGAPPASPPPAPGADVKAGERCPLRVLVAEDNAVNQRVAVLLLQRLGYRSTVVGNGEEALAALQQADYDAILMDVEMPGLDGCETTRRIRAVSPGRARPWIIALTAGAMPGDRERVVAAGMNDYLTKPVRGEALAEALARAHAVLQAGAGAERSGPA